ncbi:MAG: hypothetical protein JSV31_18865 [Desulfobacterales bacterium]|nr:MAG: hypothetical protein JSV31_18865 [Desulfobacterales bacterium]
MTTGRSTKLVGQAGEYLVAAELSRRGLIATTFTGNVHHYDIIASEEKGRHVSVQVKTIRGGSWQFSDIRQFCDITFQGKRQIIGRAKQCPVRGLICVFVRLNSYGEDKFYICPWLTLRAKIIKGHKDYLAKHKGIRPKKWDSPHTAIAEESLSAFKDRWEYIEE